MQFLWVVFLRATVHNCCILAELCPTFAGSLRRHRRMHMSKTQFMIQFHHGNPVTEALNLLAIVFIVPGSGRLF